jgi:hypothetical protein
VTIPGALGLQYLSATPFHIPRTGALFTNVVEQEFCELRPALGGHIVGLITTMATIAPTQMVTRQTHNATTS